MAETGDKPKWLLELENRKRKPRLAHEAGAGAPCTICNVACPGLDLHFWRKICKNCKCSRDDHDVEDDDYPQFDLLFGSSKKFKRKPILLSVNNGKHHEIETAFEWVPPDTTKELATDYMKALPVERLPIKGSTGAALRRQQLQKQLPLHDIDHKVCDELSEQEKKQFEKHLENIKKYVGQGKVTKILSARPFDRSLVTPVNATDMQRCSPQHKPIVPTATIQLRTPSSFSSNSPYKKHTPDAQKSNISASQSEVIEHQIIDKQIPVCEKYNVIGSPSKSETAKSESMQGKICRPSQSIDSTKKYYKDLAKPLQSESTPNSSDSLMQAYKDTCKNSAVLLAHSDAIEKKLAESMLADALLPPSNVNSGDIIASTLDEKKLMFIREKLMDKYTQENQMVHSAQNIARDLESGDLLCKSKNLNMLLNTEGRRCAIIAAMKNPPGTVSEDKINGLGKQSESKLVKAERELSKPISQMVQSVPLETCATSKVEEEEKQSQLKEAVVRGHRQTLVPPYPNELQQTCNESSAYPATDSYQAIISTSTVPSSIIHLENLYNQVFPSEVVSAGNQVTQILPSVEHLKLATEELIDMPNSQKCHNCEEQIRVGDVAVITEKTKNAAWHPGCFVCSVCNELLADLVYFYYKNKLYCGRDLATLLGIPRCFACDELIFVREYTVAEGHNYHVKHFCCWDCDMPLAGQQYITENDRPLCLPCYQKSYAKTCNACNCVIAADQQGVSVKNLNFHATESCFCCYGCRKNLLNSRMAVKEDKLFCSKECILQFFRSQT